VSVVAKHLGGGSISKGPSPSYGSQIVEAGSDSQCGVWSPTLDPVTRLISWRAWVSLVAKPPEILPLVTAT